MNRLINYYLQRSAISQMVEELNNGEDRHLITGLSGGAKPVFFKALQQSINEPILIVSPNLLQAQRTYEDFVGKLGEEYVHLYPAEELIAADFSISSYELRAQRIETLDHMARVGKGVYITPIAGMRKLIPNKERWLQSSMEFKVDDVIEVDNLLSKLIAMNYTRQEMVTAPGEFSIRGGIIDIYPLNYENPIRIELFDTDVDSIRSFSADNQRSIDKLEAVTILPAAEFIWTQADLSFVAERLQKELSTSLNKLQSDEMKERLTLYMTSYIDDLKDGIVREDIVKYASLMKDEPTSIGTYFPGNGLVIFDEIGRITEVLETLEKEERNWFLSVLEDGKIVHGVKTSYKFEEVNTLLLQRRVYLSLFIRSMPGIHVSKTISISCKPMQQFQGQLELFKDELKRWLDGNFSAFILADGTERVTKVQAILKEYDIEASIHDEPTEQGGLFIIDGDLSVGYELPIHRIAVITEAELFTGKVTRKPRAKKISNAERIKSYSEIKFGDYVVHTHHGIGKYIGIKNMSQGAVKKDYLEIIFRGEDKLYVPIDKIDLIQKYVASGDKEPTLHKLGGTTWKRTKSKVAAAVKDIADDLIKLYAKREAEKGFAFSEDDDLQRSFADAFPYEETEDQLRSIEEVKQDMEKLRPMDRLLCGDVGYGKTEVAIRAAFKAVADGKQVAFLVPTTILAQQHFETLQERFADYPVKVDILNRFRTKKEQTKTLTELKAGVVDIVIGTHRLLSKDVVYLDLGLLIVDEEQRFGVTHKERLKQLKTNVDVLTLTATPIPRTLHMSMLGVRDLSVIETPPANRFPVQTYVMENNIALVREAIEREMGRGGQAFYLYNRVDGMEQKVNELKELVPDARIGFAHGQMSEVALESTILSFLEGEYDVLVTTTIIETGIDIPNVNTLIVQDADRMGLSQLYQLRGRVGRSNRVAYGYFLYQPDKILTEVAENRLQAIKEFTELGSGFKIAMRDLSIRGAGNLLGSQQHGFIDSVGFDLYSQMLQDEIKARQSGETVEDEPIDMEISLPLNAYIPDAYIQDGYQKIQMYKRVKAIENEEDYSELLDEMIDRFGDLPVEVDTLLRLGRLKAWGASMGVEYIKQKKNEIEILISSEGTARTDGQKLVAESVSLGRAVGFSMQGDQLVLTIHEKHLKNQTNFEALEALMKLLAEAKKEAAVS